MTGRCLTALLALFALGCSSGSTGGSGAGSPSGGGVAPQGSATVTVQGQPASVFEATGVAQNIDSPKPLHAFDAPRIAPSPTGDEVHVAGVARVWETDSIYNPNDVPVTIEALVLRAKVEGQ